MTNRFLFLVWFFFIYSVIGWLIEIVSAAIHRKTFVNRGLVSGPLCPIYGFAGIFFTVFLPELTEYPVFLFLSGMCIASVLEYSAGKLMEVVFHKKMWDYSSIHKWNLDGYICMPYSLLWGLLAVISVKFLNPLFFRLVENIPSTFSVVFAIVFLVLLILDFSSTCLAIRGMKRKALSITEGIGRTSRLLENALTRQIEKRIMKSFPTIDLAALIPVEKDPSEKKIFARGCGFYKLVWMFFLGAVAGDLVETLFCWITMGEFMSRSSVIYGPFSIVWGGGCMILSALLYRYKDKSDRFIFLIGTLLGGVYEYLCSVISERLFGAIFWDYSGFTLNLGGRINLLYCFFWGFAAIIWLKYVYPLFSGWIEKIPMWLGRTVTWVLIVFMICNLAISGLAFSRYSERQMEAVDAGLTSIEVAGTDETTTENAGTETVGNETETETTDEANETETEEASGVLAGLRQALNRFLDQHYDDERMARVYPNAKIVINGVAYTIDELYENELYGQE